MAVEKGRNRAKAGRRANADAGAKPQNNNRRKPDMAQSKQELLAALTRQAEVNTRILERERAAVLALEIQTVESQTQRQMGLGLGQDPGVFQPPVHIQHGPRAGAPGPANARSKAPPPGRGGPSAAPSKAGRGRGHVFADAPGQKMVYDYSQVPGLMGAGGSHMDLGGGMAYDPDPMQRWTPLEGQEDPTSTLNGPDALEGTFPDSPGFYPGMVFGVPGSQVLPKPPLGVGGGFGTPGSADGDMHTMQPSGSLLQQQRGGAGASPRGPNGRRRGTLEVQQHDKDAGPGPSGQPGGPQSPGWAPHPGQQRQESEQQQFGGWGGAIGHGQDARRAEQAARRRELDEQVRAKQQRKDAENAALRQAEQREEAQAIAMADSPWGAMGGRRGRGGGGEPLRDVGGQAITNLRGAGGHSPGPGRGGQPPSPGPWQALGPGYPGPPGPTFHKGPPNHLSVLVPGMNGWPGPPLGPGPGPVMGPGLSQGPLQAWPERGQPGAAPWGIPPHHGAGGNGSPGAGGGPVVSPGAAGRRFMAGLQELRPGPSEDQRQHQDMQRRKLQEDLAEQIRQKREREAKAKEEEARARAKEDRDMQEYYQQMQAQKDAEQRARSDAAMLPYQQPPPMGMAGPQPSEQGLPPFPQQPPQPERLQRPPPPPPLDFGNADPHHMAGRRKKKPIEADWLDNIVLPQQQAANPTQLHKEPSGGQVGARPAGESNDGRAARPSVGGGPSPAGVTGGVGHLKAEISVLLQEMRNEQVRLREEFSRQAEVMQSLVGNGGGVLGSKDRAYQDLHRIKAQLSDSEAQISALNDSLDQFVVSTHLVPRNVTAIPSRLATPLEAEWVQAAMADGDGQSRTGIMGPRHVVQVHSPGAQYGGQYSPGPGRASPNGMREEDAQFLKEIDQLLGQPEQQQFWQHLETPQSLMYGNRRAGQGIPPLPYEDPGERGLYRPISQLAGPPSQIPRAPRSFPAEPEANSYSFGARGPPMVAERSGYGQVAPRDGPSRTAGFFNLHAPMPAAQQQQRRQPMGMPANRPPDSPPILRADHHPSPARPREKRAPPVPAGASRFGGGKGGRAGAAQASDGPKAGRQAGNKPPLIPQASGMGRGSAAGPRQGSGAGAGRLQSKPSTTPSLPPIAAPMRPASSQSTAGPKLLTALEGSMPRATSAPTPAEESVAALAASAARR